MKHSISVVLRGSIVLIFASLANAGMIYTLNLDGCSGGCGTSPFGQVLLAQNGSNDVLVTLTLFNGDEFVKTGAGNALAFNLTGNPAITISALTSGFSVGPASAHASAFGTFEYTVTCTGCGPGASSPLLGPLSFDVQLAGGGSLSISDFVGNGGGHFFAADILGTNGATGNVAADGPGKSSSAPEPSATLLGLTGLAALSGIRRTLLSLSERSLRPTEGGIASSPVKF